MTVTTATGPGATRSTWASIDLGALRSNYELARSLAGGREVIAVVKADAYGHGAGAVAGALARAGASRFAVATIDEAAELRPSLADASMLVLGGVSSQAEADAAVALRLVPVLHHEGQLELAEKAASRAGVPLDVHVEIDTGMRRLGVPEPAAGDLLRRAGRSPSLRLEGVLTHFARADEADPAHRLEPLSRFRAILAEARGAGVTPPLVHVANSPALLAFHEIEAALPEQNAVRPGLMLYGVRPAPHLTAALAPVMTFRTTIVSLRPVGPGETVGYGGSYRAPRATRIATLAVGYADGVPFALGNRGRVLLRGHRVPIVGRVSMDLVTIDVGDAPAELGDEVILFGVGSSGTLPVEEVADAAGTLAYEILVRVGRRVPRRIARD